MTSNLDTLRKIAEQATPGPWEAKPYLYGVQGGAVRVTSPSDDDRNNLAEDVLPDDSLHIATFDPPTVLALLSRLEQAEQDRVKLRNRLDAMRRQRDGYQNQLRKAEQQVQRVLEGYFAVAQPEVTGEQVNLAGWTCDGIHEPGSYATCEDCRGACDDLANFYNNMMQQPKADRPWTGREWSFQAPVREEQAEHRCEQ